MEVIPSNESGELDVAALEEMLSRGGVKAVAITHVPTNGGVVNPATEGAGEVIVKCFGSRNYPRNGLLLRPPPASVNSKRCTIRVHTAHTAGLAGVPVGAGALMRAHGDVRT